MKTLLQTSMLLIAILVAFEVGLHLRSDQTHEISSGTSSLTTKETPTNMIASKTDRLASLDAIQELPSNANRSDWLLAQKTTWWGKPLDPKTFWEHRTVWLDSEAELAARRRGRIWPPMPYVDPTLPNYRQTDSAGDAENTDLHFLGSDTQAAFWNKFRRTHPRPPVEIEREQCQMEQTILKEDTRIAQGKTAVPIEWIKKGREDEVARRIANGYPIEAFTDEALFWAYVTRERQEYAGLLANSVSDAARLKKFLADSKIDSKYLTVPLSDDELRKASKWKRDYLKRLQKDPSNSQYVNAYIQAWQLDLTEILTN